MANDDKNDTHTAVQTAETSNSEEGQESQRMYLGHGRSLMVSSKGLDEMLEIRAASGAVELRIQLTDAGPVLQLEGVRLAVKASDAIEMQCKTFSVNASESLDLHSGGELKVSSEGDMQIESTASELKVRAKMIYLN